jgi:ABC-2 type transport system ATP-binding protein
MARTIVVDQLVKQYANGQRAVDGVSFHVGEGEVFGFLGPNGAGKSTTVRMLTTLSVPTSGTVRVGGYDVVSEAAAVRRVAGVALQEVGVDPLMSANELLELQGRVFGFAPQQARQRAEELIALVGLEAAARRAAGTYSGGMRRRLDLALALVHQPAILFLDEPTTGLDPASRRAIWAEVGRLNREEGMTVFLTTQYLEEADEFAQRIAIINQGKIVAEGTPAALKAAMGNESLVLTFVNEKIAQEAEQQIGVLARQSQRDQQSLRLYLNNAAQMVPRVISTLNAAQIEPTSLTLARPSLDDVFLQVTGQQFTNTR